MVVLGMELFDVIAHCEATGELFVISFKINASKKFAFPVHYNFVVFPEYQSEVISMLFADVFDSEIICD